MTTPTFHIGHKFSTMMPEIQSICGLPVADVLPVEQCVSLDSFVDAFEVMLSVISEQDIVVSRFAQPYVSMPKLFLFESLAAFYESFE